jgi:hypothetical protein
VEEQPLNDSIVEEVLNQEGLLVIQDLFEFFSAALDVAVDWISQYEPELDGLKIQQIISGHVKGKSLEEIMLKLAALSEVQNSL